MHGPQGECLDANAVALDALGLTRAEFRSRTVSDPKWRLFDATGRRLAPSHFPPSIALRTGRPVYRPVGVFHLWSGVLRWIDVLAEPVDDSGRRLCYVQFGVMEGMPDAILRTGAMHHPRCVRAQSGDHPA